MAKKKKYNHIIGYYTTINKIDKESCIYDFTVYLDVRILPASRPRFNGLRTYIDEPYKSFKKELTKVFTAISKELNINKALLIDRILSLKVYGFIKYNKSDSNKAINKKLFTYSNKKPDLDNIIKSVMDSTIGTLCIDDNQYTNISISKINSFDNFSIVNIKISNNGVNFICF